MIYRFGRFELDGAKIELRADGAVCSIEPQVFALLTLLVENRERVVFKQEIIDKVWDGRVVSDSAVASRVKSARKALGDDGKTQRFIKTVHRHGFRFIADAKISRGAVADQAKPAVQSVEQNLPTVDRGTAVPLHRSRGLGAYIRGQMAPMQVANAQQQLQLGQAQLAMVPGQLEGQQLNLDQLRMTLQKQQIINQAASQFANGPAPAGTAGAGAQNYGGSSGGIQNGPQGSVSSGSSSPSAGGSALASSYGPAAAANMSSLTPSLSAGSMMAIGMLAPEAIKGMVEGRDAALKQQQLNAEGPLNLFDAVANSPSPARMAMANQSIISLWPKVAQQMGLDPVKDFNDQNVSRAAIFGGNQIRSQVGLPLRDMPVQQKIIRGPNGQILSQNPQTNEIKQDVAPQDLKEVIGPDGQPVYRPAGQAAGMRPFNPQLYGADSLSDSSKEMAYQRFIATGEMPPPGRGGAIQSAVMSNYIAQRAAAEGNQAAAMAARGQAYKAQQGVVDAFTSGAPATQINSINTAVKHMDALDPLIAQLNNTGKPAFNSAANYFAQQTGSAAPTNFAAIKEFVGGEVAKAVLLGGGGEAERKALLEPLDAANSNEQLTQAVGQIKTALVTRRLRRSSGRFSVPSRSSIRRHTGTEAARGSRSQEREAGPPGRGESSLESGSKWRRLSLHSPDSPAA